MARPLTGQVTEHPLYDDGEVTFAVTCEIGRVTARRDGHGEPAHVAAMRLIAEHDAPGTFTFPMADGRTMAVTVEYVAPLGWGG